MHPRLNRAITNGLALPGTVALLLVLTACGASGRSARGYATIVRWDPQGGTLALKGNGAEARRDAAARMKAYCGGAYQVVGEERVKVGEKTTHVVTSKSRSNAHQATQVEGSTPERSTTQERSVTSTRNIYERRIAYACAPPPETMHVETQPPGAPW